MACLRDQSGRSLCHVVDHPDRPDQSFCSTCGKRFSHLTPTPRSGATASGIMDLLIGILSLLLAAGVNSVAKNLVYPPPSPSPSQQVSTHSER